MQTFRHWRTPITTSEGSSGTRTILVTGGCGFIGSHFVRYLLSKRPQWRVVNLDKLTYAGSLANLRDIGERDKYRFVRGDILDEPLVNKIQGEERPWAVVNFAAESHVDRSILDSTPFLRTNVVGVQLLLDSSRQHATHRFVQISTDEVYGDAKGLQPFSEEAPLRPSSPYAASKAAADLLCLAQRRTYGTPVLIVRSVNNYGPFQFPEKLIPLMICNAVSGQALPVYGDGQQVRDWLYVEDNCDAILRVLEDGQDGTAYNVGAGHYRTNIEIIQTLCRMLAEEAPIDRHVLQGLIKSVPDRPGHDRRYAVDSHKIRSQLSWSPRLDFQEGLRTTVRWYLRNQQWVEHVKSGDYESYYQAVYVRRWDRVS